MNLHIVCGAAPSRLSLLAAGLAVALALGLGCHSGSSSGTVSYYYQSTTLVADQASGGAHVDANLLNPWGIAYGPSTGFVVANNHTGTATEYDGSGVPLPSTPLIVAIPPPAGGATSAPTGAVFNGSTDFMGDRFIFATEDGTLSGWSSGASATLRVDHSALGAVYKGLAIASVGATHHLYATNFVGGTVEVFDATYAPVVLGSGAFTDPTLPAGFSPFGIQAIGTQVYVTFAERVGTDTDETSGPGLGYVSVFATDGTFVKRLVSQGALNAPWGLAMAPASFGSFAGALLVGNFGDGLVNAYDPAHGSHLGALSNAAGQPIAVDGLWGIAFGNDLTAGKSNVLYFTAGPLNEAHGRFGSIGVVAVSTGGGGGNGGY